MKARDLKRSRARRPDEYRKKGSAFEAAVAAVAKVLQTNAKVTNSEWVEGPDGRLDRDVWIEAAHEGKVIHVLIECKDWDPRKTGPVGRGVVDALDSKRHDANADCAIICSNAGFTEDAVNKARRKGISLISASRDRDERIRFAVIDDAYHRDVTVDSLHFTLCSPSGEPLSPLPNEAAIRSVNYQGKSVLNWVIERVSIAIVTNPVVSGELRPRVKIKYPTQFLLCDGKSV